MSIRRFPKWYLPVVSLVLGVACLVSFWLGGNLREGVYSLIVLAAFGAIFAIGGRSEAIRGLRGDGRDEYWRTLDLTATALCGLVLIAVVIGMCFWEWAHGRDGTPYSQLGAIAGVTYIVALAGLRLRR